MYVFCWAISCDDCWLTRYDVCQVTSTSVLPDDVLLGIFDFCVDRHPVTKNEVEAWQTLVHVCRQWRTVVFGSPRRLSLRLYYSTTTPTPLDIWPALPLHIAGDVQNTEDSDNIVAVLERSNPVYHIAHSSYSPSLENILAAMQKPFPELTYLRLSSYEAVTVVPDSVLGGSAPRLQILSLDGIPFPGLPKLLLSATHLTELNLFNIPHAGYFSPGAIATALSTSISLRLLILQFLSPRSYPSRHPPPLTRSVLPNLKKAMFRGVSEYLEDLVALIDAPQLYSLNVALFNQILFDTPQFIQFISRTPMWTALENARLVFKNHVAAVVLSSPNRPKHENFGVKMRILCREPDWQVSSLEQVCNSWLPSLSALEDLYIYENSKSPPDWRDNIENTLWLELLHPFSAVKNLYLSKEFAVRIAPALQELVGSRTMEVLPTLQNIFVERLHPSRPAQEGTLKFVAARQLSGHPITVSVWETYVDDVVDWDRYNLW